MPYSEASKPVSQDWGKVVGGVLAPYSEASKPVSQDWGKVVGRCWRLVLKQANLSARIGVKLLGGAGAFF